MDEGMTRREAERDAWELGEHSCQIYGHCFPRSWDTNEPLPCTGCKIHPDDVEDEDEVTQTQSDDTDPRRTA